MFSTTRLRQYGVALMVLGYFTLVYVDVLTGASLRVVGNSLMLPFAIQKKMWDVVFMASLFLAIDLSKSIHLILTLAFS